ncbi:MAG: hypothetical protein H0V88_08790 [Pyrinomonadaceae bacterium]|nr:hypothetical protein [Pyrinomonadaceae bacterium]
MMRNTRTLFLFFALLLSPLVACGQAKNNTATATAGVSTQTVQFKSSLVGAELPYEVLLPPDYNLAASNAKRYPVLYLLHGLGGNPRSWFNLGVSEAASRYSLIVVLAEGRDSFYTDSASAPAEKFESYFVRELAPDVDRRFRTVASRDGRAVGGLSMGGYGALKFAIKYPEMFAVAASMSGAISSSSWQKPEDLPASLRSLLVKIFGAPDSPTHTSNDLFRLLAEMSPERRAQLPFLYFDCGTEDFLFESNRQFAALLNERKIKHEYRELPGSHEQKYWRRQLPEVFETIARELPAMNSRAAAAATTSR